MLAISTESGEYGGGDARFWRQTLPNSPHCARALKGNINERHEIIEQARCYSSAW